MERPHPPINSFLFGEEVKSDYSGELELSPRRGYRPIPFIQMLQGAMQAEEDEDQLHLRLRQQQHALSTHYQPSASSLQLLLRLQEQHQHHPRATEQHDSCITHASESKSDAAAAAAAPGTRERRKRKRPRGAPQQKKAEEAESQRLSHIAVERNRRKLMNEHLAALRDLMPPSYIQRGDQASVIGQAINFVKELEQRLLFLQAEKRLRQADAAAATPLHADFFVAPQYRSYSLSRKEEGEGMDVEATAVQGHVNLKVAGRRRAGQLVRAVAAMEDLGLTVLHLNINAVDASSSILYCFNLKQMEEECRLASADEIATAAHQIFAYINSAC